MRVTNYLLIATAALLASCGAVSTAAESKQNTLSTMDTSDVVKTIDAALMENVGKRYLRISKTETELDDDDDDDEDDDDDDDEDAVDEERAAGKLKDVISKISKFKGYEKYPKILRQQMAQQPENTRLVGGLLRSGLTKPEITALIKTSKGVKEENRRSLLNLFNGIWLQTHKGGI
ncbi:hypothetical protein PHYBOEH_000788 [Phytophthora boehmeriae]|uniref:RxLR effector protein n=1 Tax=Phytophthora boehmeriae TaxID=109152 RepID=A0A8T1X0U6_9STRA|nr:hypothetical protein PHYBOEH_000788 [Phytophthora boehmeriae]